MNLKFNTSLVEGYKSASQIACILTEDWIARNMYCSICREVSINRAKPNAPVRDYVCESCRAQYELKSKRGCSERFSTKVADGVYRTMIERISSLDNPSFFFMHYDRYEVNNLIIVPNCFFVPEVIERREPLSAAARQIGWKGCNILLDRIPGFAKIPIIQNGVVLDPKSVSERYKKVYSLQMGSIDSRGWLIDVLKCVERLGSTFSLKQMYGFVEALRCRHPKNKNIEAKIRQQLQFLRDKGIIDFQSRGNYVRVVL